MLKLIILGGVIFYIFKLIGRDSSIAQKSSPFINQPGPRERKEVIEDIDYIEKKS